MTGLSPSASPHHLVVTMETTFLKSVCRAPRSTTMRAMASAPKCRTTTCFHTCPASCERYPRAGQRSLKATWLSQRCPAVLLCAPRESGCPLRLKDTSTQSSIAGTEEETLTRTRLVGPDVAQDQPSCLFQLHAGPREVHRRVSQQVQALRDSSRLSEMAPYGFTNRLLTSTLKTSKDEAVMQSGPLRPVLQLCRHEILSEQRSEVRAEHSEACCGVQ